MADFGLTHYNIVVQAAVQPKGQRTAKTDPLQTVGVSTIPTHWRQLADIVWQGRGKRR